MNYYAASEVFAPGTFPTHTFSNRSSTTLQSELSDYLRTGLGSCLIVHGPSKTGKTVLVERWLPPDNAIWIRGDEVDSLASFHSRIVDALGLYTKASTTSSQTTTAGTESSLGLDVIPASMKYTLKTSLEESYSKSTSRSRDSLPVSAVKQALSAKPVPIVIDDFHFINPEVREKISETVKDLIRLTRVILIAIPHVAFEPLRLLRDMDWRIIDLEVTYWETSELKEIARDGFPLLNINDREGVLGERLAEESRGAPFIMQALCLAYVDSILHIHETAPIARAAVEPDRWHDFLSRVATRRKPGIFEKFATGKDSRGQERKVLKLMDGQSTDIYGAILLTLKNFRSSRKVDFKELSSEMGTLIQNAPPASSGSQTLGHLADIAEKNRGQGDPALTYIKPELEIVDPVLSFYIHNADWKLPAARSK